MERLILAGAAVLDGTGTPPAAGRAVVVEDGRISDVVAEAEAPAGRTLRLDGLTLLPGLVNSHVHLCLGGEADPVRHMREDPLGVTVIKALVRARQALEAGVTTVRDLGGRDYAELAVRDAVRDGLVPGPRILAAGKVVCMTGGHGFWIGREADGPVDVRRAVREQLRAGADLVKLIATGGLMTRGVQPGASQLDAEEIRAAVAEARRAGRLVAAHAQGTDGIAACVDAGITTIEHGIFLTEELAARMARERIYLVPTLVAGYRIASEGVKAGIPEFMARKAEAVIDRFIESFRMALRAGVPIAAGSDAGTPLNPHGSLVPELDMMVRAGMPPLEAVRSATRVAAEALGLGHEIGRVAPGYAADLVAVAGDPADGVECLDSPAMVMTGGRIVVNRLSESRSHRP